MAGKRYPLGPRHKIEVTNEDVTNGVVSDSTRCMIMEAIKRSVPNATKIAVDIQTCRYSDLSKGQRYVYLTPYAAQLALLQFDEGTRPKAFSFILRNAHVTHAGVSTTTKASRIKSKQRKRGSGSPTPPVGAILAGGQGSGGTVPRRVGGRRPPQLRIMRQFGLRAFRGASQKRIDAEVPE